jgi:type II secretory pathway pseudopilin PulG
MKGYRMHQNKNILIFNNKKTFSFLELMAVILVILLLISLLTPIFVNVKMNARNALCKNQLRQIGIFFNSYTSDNGGYLPNDKSLDLFGTPDSHDMKNSLENASGNSLLYEGWNGHLLPYIESFGKDYTKRARLGPLGLIKSYKKVGSGFLDWNLEEKVTAGWNWGKSKEIVVDSIERGGHHDLKVFICPEIHTNTFDIDYANANNDKRIPRITQLGSNINFWDPLLPPGLPTTYLANSTFFGCDDLYYDPNNTGVKYFTTDTRKSLRIDEISTISKKAMIVEGGRVAPPWPFGQIPYYDLADLTYHGVKRHRLSYTHDVFNIFWIIKISDWHDGNGNPEMENAFNLNFKGKAEMIIDPTPSSRGYAIISLIEPFDKPFDKFLLTYGIPSNKIILEKTYDFSDYHYLTGSLNVLFGDGAVQTSTISWLSQNRRMVSGLTSE